MYLVKRLWLLALVPALLSFTPITRYIKKAELSVEKGKLAAAKDYFLKALAMDPENPRANYGYGILLSELLDNFSAATPHLEKAYAYHKTDTLYDVIFALAKCYHHNGDYQKAITFYEKLNGVIDMSEDTDLQKEIRKSKQDCLYAIAHQDDPPSNNQFVVNAGKTINTDMPEYVPVMLPGNKFLFTSKRQDNEKEQINYVDGKYFESMYIADVTGKGFSNVRRFEMPDRYLRHGSSKKHEAVVSMSSDAKKLFIFRNSGIYETDISGGNPGKPRRLETSLNKNLYQNHAFLSDDGNSLFFTSEAEGGKGGTDIYKCTKTPDGKWSVAVNLGEPVNTVYDEDAPFLSHDGRTLYFASKGHDGFGNYDIYRSEFQNGTWSTPVNLGKPINSPGHDIFLVQDSSLSTAYFSSGRNGGMGDMDIYKVIYLDKIKKDCPSEPSPVISLQVLDEDTSDFKNAIEVKAPANYSVLSYSWRFNNEERPANARFENDYRAAGTYSIESKVVALCDTCLNPVIACNTVLNDFKPRATVPTPSLPITFDINNFKGELDDEQLNKLGFNPSPIYFDFDRSSLRDDAITVLENNIVALLKYPNLNVRIVGYTDSRGPDTYNKILSERRAKAAHSYLLKKGIPSSRVELVEGKGASDLLNNCGKGKRCSESEHQKNRRVIFIISINKS